MGGSVTKHDSTDGVSEDQYGLPAAGGRVGVAQPDPTTGPAAGLRAAAAAQHPSRLPADLLEGASTAEDSPFVDKDRVPAVFKWAHGGSEVYVTGTFTGWRDHKRMHRSGHDFTYIAMLPRGKHHFKFIVDGQWRWTTNAPTETDADHNVNNVVDLGTFRRDDAEDPDEPESDDEAYGTAVPDEVTYTKEPPYLPPQLRHILLNAEPLPAAQGVPVLPEPLPVTLDHLYCTAIRDGVMVQGLTRRFRSKYTSTVFYTMMPVSPTLRLASQAGWTPPGSAPTAGQPAPPRPPAAAVHAGPSASSGPGAGASADDTAVVRQALTAAAANPAAAPAIAAALSQAQRGLMLARLRSRLEGVSVEMHESALREYQQAGRTLTADESARLFDAVKGEAHRRLNSEDAEYQAVYALLQLAHQGQPSSESPGQPA
ncbi:hypothetical protein FNF27_04340 [Cafeteria roenbergensis]|uniref:Association with the SNF1 complex (ASC) domain-containing protein n=2 Tax=Cafeteria roenbergensis TaxID=33653 RepID=A0A5A8E9D1_CAFRO|nr:hypothetical protein FNF27_04340 [Cafeteria roenbergensis]